MIQRYILILLAIVLFAASSIAQTRTTLKRRPPADIRQIDFRNYDYPKGDGTIRVQNGKWKGQYPGEVFNVEKIVYGDVTGDGEEEAVSVISESGGGSGQSSGAFIFTLRDGRVVRLSSKDREGYGPYDGIKGGDRGDGGIYNVIIDSGALVVEQYAPGDGPNAPPYQPAYIETTIYTWNGSLFIPNRKVGRRPFSLSDESGQGTPRRETLKRRDPTSNDKIVINGVQVNNFYSNNIGNYGDVILLLSGVNTIQFDRTRNTFQISIEGDTPSGFAKNREIVENELLRLLGITKGDACRLQVEETAHSSRGLDSRIERLSFCSMVAEAKPKAPSQSTEWNLFWTAFRAAVRMRDRAALRQMMANSFEYGSGERVNSQRVFSELDYGGGENWRVLERTLDRGVLPYKLPNSRRPGRVAKNPLPCGKRPCDYTAWAIFELGTDDRWRWVSFIFPGD